MYSVAKKYTSTKVTKSELVADILSGAAAKPALENIKAVLDKVMAESGLATMAIWQIDLNKTTKSDPKHEIRIPFRITPSEPSLNFLGAEGTLVVAYTCETWSDFKKQIRSSCRYIVAERYEHDDTFPGYFVIRLLQTMSMIAATRSLTVAEMSYMKLCGQWLIDRDVHVTFGLDLEKKSCKPLVMHDQGGVSGTNTMKRRQLLLM